MYNYELFRSDASEMEVLINEFDMLEFSVS